MKPNAIILVFWMLNFKPAFYSPPSPSSRSFLVPFCFLPLEWYHLHIWGYWYFSWQSWFQLVTHPAWHFAWWSIYISSILVIWWEQLTPWKSPWCWESLRAEGEEGVRGRDGWMPLPMQWTSTWAYFGRWWGTETTGVLQSMGSQRVKKNWATEQKPLCI